MNANDLKHFRKLLDGSLTRLRADATAVTAQALGPSGGQAGGALTNVPLHLGDEGTDEYLHDINAALVENEEYLVGETSAAMARIDRGEYGQCESCGQSIARERLEAMPYTRFCVGCAATNHAGVDVNLNYGRPSSPRDTLAPEGAMSESWRDRGSPLMDSNPEREGAADIHAVGEAGGGTALGGLAGSNEGHGDPIVSELQEATGSGKFDADEARDVDHREAPRSGRSGGAVGGTPARKRAK